MALSMWIGTMKVKEHSSAPRRNPLTGTRKSSRLTEHLSNKNQDPTFTALDFLLYLLYLIDLLAHPCYTSFIKLLENDDGQSFTN